MRLRDHQIEALAAIEAAAAAGEQRMTVVSACGTGKTLIAQQAAQRVAPHGAALVLMPTKALVTQTGHRGLALGVCSLSQTESGLSPSEGVMTRYPRAIARAMRVGGPVTVFATYDSLHHIQDAHDFHGLAPWDLVIADEAHRTCSAFGDGWGTIHDDAAVPAKIRLYMTATPRVWDTTAPDELVPFMERIPLATMDHREIFGPTVFELGMAEAIERGILADYQVVMPIVDDEDLHSILAERRPGTSAHHDRLRNAALQIAVLRAIAENGLRRVLVFHNRVALAEAFAASLPTTALEVGGELRIENLWSQAIHSQQSADWRRDLLDDFADPGRACAVLSNVRVLNEGVDMPDVDAVVFGAPRYSVIDAVQAIGRGLRQPPGARKKTTLVIPVYLRRGADVADLLEDSAFANLVTLLQALRSHDESFMDRIALPARSRSATAAGRRAIHYARPERAAQLARALGLELTVPAIGTWEQAHAAAAAYRTISGHLDVPTDYTDPDGFALGECLANFRLRLLLDRLPAEQKQVLDQLGMLWTAPAPTFESMLEHARAWAAVHGHLLVPVKEDIGGHRLGRWLATQRRKANTGRLPDSHQRQLEAIDPHWNTSWPQDWQRKYLRAKALVHATGWRFSSHSYNHASREDRAIMDWISKQRLKFFGLEEGQQDLLLQLGIPPLPDGVYYDSSYDPERHAFYGGLGHAAVALFMSRDGGCTRVWEAPGSTVG
ncbi:helicase [Streptomyces echinoruber]|uniref:Helicase n=1 Tax=Streptomyces echinoruber TaxID=68898 RepID=A0A918RAY0_9ACTN|nr:DEAD/DEAH box helicase [Streptomyces echinoruber]GGZ92467.1 helicase [Streptomyces echinoruber]